MRCIASFKTACRIVGAGTSCFVQNIKMLVRSIARTLFEGDLLLSVNDETRQGALRFWNNDGDALAPSETGGPREVTIQSRIHSNDEQLL